MSVDPQHFAIRVTRRRVVRDGTSLVEVAIASGLMGLLLATSLATVGASIRSHRFNADRLRAELLAQDLLDEIQSQRYLEPYEVSCFGPESTEQRSPPLRAAFDDIDDYHLWFASPPQSKDGVSLPGLAGWSRSVTVTHVDPANFNTSLPDTADQGFKKITITVARDGVVLLRKYLVRSSAWQAPPYD